MLVCLKGVENEVEIASTVPLGIASYPNKTDNPVAEHFIHFFVQYNGAWAEVSRRTYNSLIEAGNPPQNI